MDDTKDKFHYAKFNSPVMHPKRFEALEKRVETLETKLQDLIDNIRIFIDHEEEEEDVSTNAST